MIIDVPPSQVGQCVYCTVRLNKEADGTYRLVTGWSLVGGKQKRGLSLAAWQATYACERCISNLSRGIPAGQLSLLESGEYDKPVGDAPDPGNASSRAYRKVTDSDLPKIASAWREGGPEEVAKRFGVSIRQANRYIALARQAGDV